MNYWSSLVKEEVLLSLQRRLELIEQRLEITEMRVAKVPAGDNQSFPLLHSDGEKKKAH